MKSTLKKLRVTLIIMLLLFATRIHAQKTYLKLGGGYGFPAASNMYLASNNSQKNNGTSTTYRYEIIDGTGSFGKGAQAGATIGQMFSENIGAELNIWYLIGDDIVSSYDETGTNNYHYQDQKKPKMVY